MGDLGAGRGLAANAGGCWSPRMRCWVRKRLRTSVAYPSVLPEVDGLG